MDRIKIDKPIQPIDIKIASESFPFGQYLQTTDGKEYILDENGVTILLFEKDENGNITSIYSPLSKRNLRKEILCLPEEQ